MAGGKQAKHSRRTSSWRSKLASSAAFRSSYLRKPCSSCQPGHRPPRPFPPYERARFRAAGQARGIRLARLRRSLLSSSGLLCAGTFGDAQNKSALAKPCGSARYGSLIQRKTM